MSGTPTEAELQAQWQAAVDILETTRNYADGTLAGSGGLWDVLTQALEGEYTPSLAGIMDAYRANVSALLDPGIALDFLTPLIFEYGQIMAADATYGFGSGYTDLSALMGALYEHFDNNSLTVQSRNITYGTPTISGTGNTTMTRLTVDENSYNLEFCHVEQKRFRCRTDQNTGTDELAEEFEFLGEQASFDSILRASFGSGESQRTFITNHNAGGSSGGSWLRNSSFSTFDATASPEFDGWDLSTGTQPTQALYSSDPTYTYITHPGAATDHSEDASIKFTTDAKIVQTLDNMRVTDFDRNTPYFCRIMANIDVGSASGGSLTLRLGSKSATLDLVNFGTGWNEIRIGDGTLDGGAEDPSDCWFKNFNEDSLDVEIEWASASSGYILIDDAILAPWDLVDGTYWFMRHAHPNSPTSPLVDDQFKLTDTGGAPATGKVQWWLFVAGLGYLPSTTGTPTFADP